MNCQKSASQCLCILRGKRSPRFEAQPSPAFPVTAVTPASEALPTPEAKEESSAQKTTAARPRPGRWAAPGSQRPGQKPLSPWVRQLSRALGRWQPQGDETCTGEPRSIVGSIPDTTVKRASQLSEKCPFCWGRLWSSVSKTHNTCRAVQRGAWQGCGFEVARVS